MKLDKELAYGTRDHTDAHQVETRVEQQVVGRVHHGVEHVGSAHAPPYEREQCAHYQEAHASTGILEAFQFHQ